MKRWLFLVLIGLLAMSCEKEDSFDNVYKNVVSEDDSVPFEEILILLNIKATDSTYLVVKSIDSVKIFINGLYWAKINSQVLDTSKVEKYSSGNMYQTDNKLNYLIIAEQEIAPPNFNTAGAYSQYLNSGFELKPGEYACLVESFRVTFNDNSVKEYYPFVYKTFKVEKNSKSAFVGEFELKIN